VKTVLKESTVLTLNTTKAADKTIKANCRASLDSSQVLENANDEIICKKNHVKKIFLFQILSILLLIFLCFNNADNPTKENSIAKKHWR